MCDWDIPGGVVIETLPFNAGVVGSLVGKLISQRPQGPLTKTENISNIVTHSKET